MYLYLYKFAKKENSTATPTGQPYGVNALLKEDTDILHPVFELTDYNFSADYNYIKCSIYGADRYYFVRKIVYETQKLIYMYCDIDVLATWKTDIVATTQFLTRCSDATKYVNTLSEFLNDSANPATVRSITSRIDRWDLFKKSTGYYIVGFNAKGISHPLATRGSVTYVVMDRTDLGVMINDLFTLTGTLGDLAPIQYIVSCVYIPFDYSASDFDHITTEQIDLGGNYSIGIMYEDFKSPKPNGMIDIEHDLSIGDHPDAASHGKYLNYPPYRKIHVLAGPFGDFDIPIEITPQSLRYQIHVDLTDGSATLEICNQYVLTTGKISYMRLVGQVGTTISLAQVVTNTTLDAYKVGTHLASSLGSAIGFNFGGSVAEMGAAVMSAYEGNIPKLTTSGSNGSIASMNYIDTNEEYVSVIDSDLSHVGKPMFKNIALNSIASGSFVMCRNAIVEIGGLVEEQREIIAKMENGFYLE